MDRVLLLNQSSTIPSSEELLYFVVNQKVNKITTLENSHSNILINYLEQGEEINIVIEKNSSSVISFLNKGNCNGVKINIEVKENSKVEAYFADFSSGKETFYLNATLVERGATINWHLASLTAGKDNKQFDISVDHIAGSTFARMDNYGVCKDEGKLVFSGVSTIRNGSKGSKTHQNSKIMVFDELSIGIAKPILKIDENDIEASHAAVVGKINDDHLFYLTSRGLTESAAKELITFGYLKPIMNGFVEEELKNEISELIEGKM